MKIIVTGGGTAGHVTPLLAVASSIKHGAPDSSIRYIGKKFDKHLNAVVANSDDIEKNYSIFAGKLRRFHGKKLSWYLTQPKMLLQNLRDIFYLILGTLESIIIMLFWRPDVVFVKGGYVGLPVGLAAAFLRIPIITHDSDTLPGLTNRIVSKYATKIGVGQPLKYYPQYPQAKLVYCGVPISDAYLKPKTSEESKKALNIPLNTTVIAVIGGSLGAVRLNEAILEDLDEITSGNRFLVWISGKYHYKQLEQEVKAHSLNNKVKLEAFTSQMPDVLNSADIVVSRTGATSLAELAALKKATILVPNPLLTGGHQLINAKAYQDAQAAIVIQEEELKASPKTLGESISKIASNGSLKSNLEINMSKFAVPQSANIIARLILNVGARQ